MPNPVTPSDVRRDIERVIDHLGHVPTHTEYSNHGEYTPSTVAEKFDDRRSYNGALCELGYEPPPTERTAPTEALKADVERVVDELGYTPTRAEYADHGEYSPHPIAARFDDEGVSFRRAIRRSAT